MSLYPQKIYKITKIALAISIALFAIWLFDKNFSPRGKLVLSYNFNREKTPYVKFIGFSEPEKTFSEKKWYRRVLTSPAQIQLTLPRPYQKIKISLEYQNPGFPLLYLAAQQKTKEFSGEKIEIIENNILDKTPWYRLEDKDKNLVLLQKGKDKCQKEIKSQSPSTATKANRNKKFAYEECQYKYSQEKDPEELLKPGNQEKKPWQEYQFESVNDFLKNISEVINQEKVATFNYDIIPYLKIKNYQPRENPQTFEKTLRGRHEILTYIKNEPLEFTFFYQDINRKKGRDEFHILLKQGNKIFAHYFQPDDGNLSKNGKKSAEKILTIKKENLPEGFYELEIAANSDLIINKIETRQRLFAFKNVLHLAKPTQNFEFYTNATNISFEPKHSQGLNQEIKIIPQPKTKFSLLFSKSNLEQPMETETTKILKIKNRKLYWANLSGLNKISLQKNDLKINFDGLAATNLEIFEKFNFSNLKSLSLPLILDNPENVDYILTTTYQPPKQISESWKRQTVEFDLTELGVKGLKPKLSLFLYIPKFPNGGEIKIRKIKIILEKEPWNLDYLKNVFLTKFKKVKPRKIGKN